MRKKWMIVIILTLFPFFYISPAGGKICNQVVAIVNQEILTQKELQGMVEYLREESSPEEERLVADPNSTPEAVKQKALESLINERLQLQEAQRMGISVYPEEIDQNLRELKVKNGLRSDHELERVLEDQHMSMDSLRAKIEKGILLIKLRDRAVHTKVQLDDSEIADYVAQRNREGGGSIRLSHILFSLPEGADEERVDRVRSRARQVYEEVQRSGDFALAAGQYSDDTDSSGRGGDLGYLGSDEICLPFQKEIARLKIGEISQPVRTPFGFHLIQVTGRQAGQVVKNSEQWNKIKETILSQKVQKLYEQWLEGLRKQAYIEIK